MTSQFPASAFNPDDPRLTAFALGELDEQERAEFEQFLEGSEEAREAVSEIQETIGLLRDELVAEPAPSLTDEQRAAVAMASGAVAATAEELPTVEVAATPVGTPVWRSWRGIVASVTTVTALCLVLQALPEPDSALMGDAIGDATLPQSAIVAHTLMIRQREEFSKELETETAVAEAQQLSRSHVDSIQLLRETMNQAVTAEKLANEEQYTSRRDGQSGGRGRKERDISNAASTIRLPGENIVGQDLGVGEVNGNTSNVVPGYADRVRRRLSGAGGTSPSSDRADDDKSSPSPVVASGSTRLASVHGARDVGLKAEKSGKQDNRSRAKNGTTTLTTIAEPQPADPASANSSGGAPQRGGQQLGQDGQRGGDKGKSGSNEGRSVTGFAGGGVAAAGDASPGSPIGTEAIPLAAELAEAKPAAQPKPGESASPAGPRSEAELSKTAPLRLETIRPQSGAGKSLGGQAVNKPQQPVADAPVGESVPGFEVAATESRLKLKSPEEKALEDLQDKVYSFYIGFGRESTRTSPKREPLTQLPRPHAYNEAYDRITENAFIRPILGDKETQRSTFSVDVDTASYANVRRFLDQGQFPPKNAVRVEELINYFHYDYPQPEGEDPFSVSIEVNICPWQPRHYLARIGLQAKNLDEQQRPPTNLVFLIDISGSMRAENKLPLVRASMNMLVRELTEDDQVAIVTYSNTAELRLATTSGAKKTEITQVIDGLTAGGSTNGAGGIQLAYDTAVRKYIDGGANRVIICTDGDFNVGISEDDKLVELIQEKAASGVFLSVFGFGMGNLKDAKLEKLADKGNGQYGYIDSQGEAKKVFSEELVGTLYTVAKDVKAQVDFNPEKVGAYRLVGYENRVMANRDFTDDTKDAGDIGAGHSVTALYEIVPRSAILEQPGQTPLKYQGKKKKPAEAGDVADPESTELFTVWLRYKLPDEETSKLTEKDYPVQDIAIRGQAQAPTGDFVWASAVASFGMNLRESKYRGNFTFREVLAMAHRSVGEDEHGHRKDFIGLVTKAARLAGQGGELEAPEVEGPVARPTEIESGAARIKAGVDGKYRRLVKKIEVRDDFRRFKGFHDYGYWDGTEYAGNTDLLPGFWVYVYPHWYIWGEESKKPEPPKSDAGAEAADPVPTPDQPEETSDAPGGPAPG
jgi:Ca-activated chloride channel family protein